MSYLFNIHEAKTSLSKLIALVEAGEEVTIARNGVPVVQLLSAKPKTRPKFAEIAELALELPDGFDSATEKELDLWNRIDPDLEQAFSQLEAS